jgi:hypothetical protein
MLPDAIARVALLGWHVHPASRVSRAAAFKGAHHAATSDLNTLTRWARDYPRCNWRVIFGPSGLWGLDCDVPPGHAHDGVAGMKALVDHYSPLPPGPRMRSGGGGLGVFFAHSTEPIRGDAGHPTPGIDPKRGAQSQTIPPSIHLRTGEPYRWLVPPWEVAPPVAPAWLLRLMRPPPAPTVDTGATLTTEAARRALDAAAMRVIRAGEGHRNDALNKAAFRVGTLVAAGTLDMTSAARELLAAAVYAGLPRTEAALTIHSGLKGGRLHGGHR